MDEVLSHERGPWLRSKKVRTFILEKSPAGAAAELANQVKCSSIQALVPLLSSVSIYLSAGDRQTQFVKDELFKLLLVQIVEGSDRSVCANCGTALGFFFSCGMLLGDPFQLATDLLQRGIVSVAQADGICTLAVASNATPLPISKASFWAMVGHVAAEVSDTAIRTALLGHLRHLKQQTIPWPISFSPSEMPPCSLQVSSTAQHQQGEARRRTVYVSHLPAQLPQNTLMEFLSHAGVVDKVRVCVSPGYSTMFAFVEMHTVKGAKVAIELNGGHMMGCVVRVQAARNPIQDVMSGDAIYSPTGLLQQHCLFGQSSAPLAACATEPSCVIRHQM
ncbi:hypothetical protein STCU_05501 [Strigomonas culicis]|uniref:RRM domain-containing protein n=1 Tax=Strigomonas culicis TaxID=28005 RepID=S9UAL7_9TRYP|nr:hypothetical protein STCU_05501 [Strigomonas culicis]|eukprot:EPY27837.1 hypothetical protein STCU_05501 [Strigomonas culicis]